jgi:hypothetical protein
MRFSWFRQASVRRPQPCIKAAPAHQLAMGARFNRPARIHDKDPVAANDALEPVCDEHDRALTLELLQGADQELLMVLIEGTRRLIEDQERRPGQ